MKKLSIVCLTIITCLSLASFTPSLDGKARIAISDEFPRGLFARAKGYFPGDTINVTNLITEKTCEVLVVGTLLQDENVSLLLSYEAGLALGIGPLQEIFVKLAKRAGQFDERVSSVAIISRVLGDNFAFNTEANSFTQEQPKQDISSEQAESKIDEKNFEDENNFDIAKESETLPSEENFEDENFLVADNSLLSEDDFTNPNFVATEENSNNENDVADEVIAEDERLSIEPSVEFSDEYNVSEEIADNIELPSESIAQESVEMENQKEIDEHFVLDDLAEDDYTALTQSYEDSPLDDNPILPQEEVSSYEEDSNIALDPLTNESSDSLEETFTDDSLVPLEENFALADANLEDSASEDNVVEDSLVAEDVIDENYETSEDVAEEQNQDDVLSETKNETVAEEEIFLDGIALEDLPTSEDELSKIEEDNLEKEDSADIVESDNLKIAEQTLEDETSDSIEIADRTEVTDEQFAEEEFGTDQFAEENFDLTEDANLALNDTSTDTREENFAIAEDTESFEESPVEENSDVFAAISLEDSNDENLQEDVQVEEMSANLEVSDDFSDSLANNNEASVYQDVPIASSSLESGKYYVQIAALSSEKNIRETVSKYEKIYPVVLVPLSSGKATQIMIGPLSVDEYGAVIERFKAEGYKDVFARKGK